MRRKRGLGPSRLTARQRRVLTAPTVGVHRRRSSLHDEVWNWDRMAEVVGVHPWTLRTARGRDRYVRRCIHKKGGRYWSVVGELMNLRAHFLERASQRAKLRALAKVRPRRKDGTFARFAQGRRPRKVRTGHKKKARG